MKQILLALGIVCLAQANAGAQSKNAINYNVCMHGNGYAVCDKHSAQAQKQGGQVVTEAPDPALSLLNTQVNMGYRTASINSSKRNPRLRVSADDPNGAYEGKETRINDGLQKNKIRNINYQDASVVLPPNDGSSN
jgi:hypothetical protein